MEVEPTKTSKKKKSRFFETYIPKILKQISTDNGITSNAKQQLNSALCVIARMISSLVVQLTIIGKKKTISDREVENCVRILMEKDLAQEIINTATVSIDKFNSEEIKHSSRQNKAGIIFPPSQIEKFLRNFGYSKIMMNKNTPVYCATILNQLTIIILTSASDLTKRSNRVRITIRDLELAVRNNPDLDKLWKTCSINFVGGGVVPYIHENLLVKKQRKKRQSKNLDDAKKQHRFRAGTVSIREIRKFQKSSNCLTLAKFPFERLVRQIVNEYQDGTKISKDVFIILQYYIEQFVIDFLRDANAAAIHANRVKLIPTDINFIAKLRNYEELNPGKVDSDDDNIISLKVNEVS